MRGPFEHHNFPRSSFLKYVIGRSYLTLTGWDTEGELPEDGKAVLIAHPHTSNWDLPFMLAVAWTYRLELNWLGKHTLFKGWRGPFMRLLGGIPVDRRAPKGQVGQAVDRIEEAGAIILAVPPSGTRSKRDHWKSGFYFIAKEAEIPIVMGYLDFGRKKGGCGGAFVPTGDVKVDMDRIRDFYEGMTGLRPDLATAIRLKAEDEDTASEPIPHSGETPKTTNGQNHPAVGFSTQTA